MAHLDIAVKSRVVQRPLWCGAFILQILSLLMLIIMTGFASAASPVSVQKPGVAALEYHDGQNKPGERHSLVVRGDHSYPPFEYLNKQGQPEGFDVDIMRAVAKAMGLAVKIDLGVWDEVKQQLERGEIDALVGMYDTTERRNKVSFSVPYLIPSYSLFVRDGSVLQSLADAKGKTIIVHSGDVAHEYLRENGITTKIIAKKEWKEVLVSLSKGEGDCAVGSRLLGMRLIRELAVTNIKPVGAPVIQRKYCFAVTKGSAELLAQLNEGLSIIKQSGEYDAIYKKWFSGVEEQPFSLTGAFKRIVWFVVPLIAFSIVGFLWSWSLKKQVSKQTVTLQTELLERRRIEDALRKSEETFRTVFNNAPVGLAFTDNAGVLQDCNLTFAKIFGAERQDYIGMNVISSLPEGELRENIAIKVSDYGVHSYEGSHTSVVTGKKLFLSAVSQRVSADMVITIVSDISERKQAEDELLHSSRLQELLMNMAATYINLPLEEVEHAIHASLRETAEFVNADRSFIYQYDFDREQVRMTHEWCSEGKLSVYAQMQAIPFDEFPASVVESHRRGEIAWVARVTDLPESRTREIMENMGLKSSLSFPLLRSGDCIGFVGFVWVKDFHSFTDTEKKLLWVFANMLVNINQRKKDGEELVRHRDHLEEQVEERTIQLGVAIEQLKSAVSSISVARDAADAANRAKSMFLANMSHEIRTPMNAVLGFAQLLERDPSLSPAARNKVATIMKSGEHLLAIINDILEMSRIEAGRVEIRTQPVDLHFLLDDLAVMFRLRAEEKGLSFTLDILPDLSCSILADLGKLRQVLINLLGNAIKFTKTGAITLRAYPSGVDRIAIEVRDTGIGITPEEQEKLFRPFERTRSGEQAAGGTGLGLAISREYAHLMNGEITVNSRVGEGSCFRFEFDAPVTAVAPAPSEKPHRVTGLVPGQGELRILVVDDRSTNRELLRGMLEPLGFIVDEACDGKEAIEKTACFQPRAILMDLVMPNMDGEEATRILRISYPMEALAIIGITASAFEETKQQFIDAGINYFITKPFREQELYDALTEHAGIKFETENDEAGMAQLSQENVPTLANMPYEWQEAFREALGRRNITRLRQLGEETNDSDPILSAWMLSLVRLYDLEGLKRLL